jgi:hypothetical protein
MQKLFISLILFNLPGLFAQSNPGLDTPLKIGTNYRIYPGSVTQSEVFIVKSPVDQNILFSSCNTLNFIPFFISEGIYVTTDAHSWKGNDTCTGNPITLLQGWAGLLLPGYILIFLRIMARHGHHRKSSPRMISNGRH